MSASLQSFDNGGFTPLISRRTHDDAEFDITAMVDLVFLMNLYFLVAFISAALGEINLPPPTTWRP